MSVKALMRTSVARRGPGAAEALRPKRPKPEGAEIRIRRLPQAPTSGVGLRLGPRFAIRPSAARCPAFISRGTVGRFPSPVAALPAPAPAPLWSGPNSDCRTSSGRCVRIFACSSGLSTGGAIRARRVPAALGRLAMLVARLPEPPQRVVNRSCRRFSSGNCSNEVSICLKPVGMVASMNAAFSSSVIWSNQLQAARSNRAFRRSSIDSAFSMSARSWIALARACPRQFADVHRLGVGLHLLRGHLGIPGNPVAGQGNQPDGADRDPRTRPPAAIVDSPWPEFTAALVFRHEKLCLALPTHEPIERSDPAEAEIRYRKPNRGLR